MQVREKSGTGMMSILPINVAPIRNLRYAPENLTCESMKSDIGRVPQHTMPGKVCNVRTSDPLFQRHLPETS